MKFTCIICTYNPKKEWLDRAVQSAINSDFDEIVLVDDGSTKNITINTHEQSKDIINVIVHEKNKGFYEAKNTAIKNSTGDIIATLDDDDYFDAAGVNKLKKHVEISGADIWHFKLQMFGNCKGIYGADANPKDLTSFNAIPGISWFRKRLWEELGGFSYPLAEDWDMWLRAYKAGKKFDYFSEIVYNFNKRSDSVSAKWTGEKFEKIRKDILERNK